MTIVCTIPIRSTEIGVEEVESAIANLRHAPEHPKFTYAEKHARINALLSVREHMLGRCTCCDA